MFFGVVTGLIGEFLQKWLEKASGPWLYVIAFVMTFAETGTLLFFIPGEITLLFVGAAAGAGDLNLGVLIAVAIVAALAGDATGFHLGKRYGVKLKSSWVGRRLKPESWERAERLVVERKGLIVLVGRWVGFLRAIMPATAGMSGMRYSQFVPFDVLGAVSWATVCVVGGYLLGENFTKLEKWLGRGGTIVGVVVVLGLLTRVVVKKRRVRQELQEGETS
jgi:membrane protein DedA with SNARE-associated domain